MSWAFLSNFAAPIKAKANQFLRNQAATAIRSAGLDTLRTVRRGSGLDQRLPAALKLAVNTPVIQGTTAGVGGITAVDVSNRTGLTGQIEGALNRVGPALDQLFSGAPQAIQQYGREAEKQGFIGALDPTFGLLSTVFPSNTSMGPTPQRRPIASLPPDYKQTELQAGAAAEAFRPGAGFPGQQQFYAPGAGFPGQQQFYAPQISPEERAYNQERSRIAQLTSATPEERSKLRDEGMRIWAAKYGQKGGLAEKVKPGQSGYDIIQKFLQERK